MGVVAVDQAHQFEDRIKPIMVVIPAYNEAENLGHLLKTMPQAIDGTEVGVLVVDDGSSDATRAIVIENNCLVVSNPINRGGGASLRLGYDILKKTTAQICVTMDADCQHRPEDMPALVRPIIDKKHVFVIGSRIIGQREKDSLLRITGVYTFGWLISMLLGQKITDPSSGYRAFDLEIMKTIDLHEDQYHTSELIIEAVRKGITITERPITIMRRKYGKSKKGRNVKYALNFCRSIMKAWWR
jgi:glycosyltransferase involved in cell wall biosynthesis